MFNNESAGEGCRQRTTRPLPPEIGGIVVPDDRGHEEIQPAFTPVEAAILIVYWPTTVSETVAEVLGLVDE
ncbi:MAG: hypothetical protein WC745_02475 [Patescibacteria group bacterium]|jgi:hypothetical protein